MCVVNLSVIHNRLHRGTAQKAVSVELRFTCGGKRKYSTGVIWFDVHYRAHPSLFRTSLGSEDWATWNPVLYNYIYLPTQMGTRSRKSYLDTEKPFREPSSSQWNLSVVRCLLRLVTQSRTGGIYRSKLGSFYILAGKPKRTILMKPRMSCQKTRGK